LARIFRASRGPGYSTTFRAAGRPFQLLVAFGRWPTDELLAEVLAILDSLEFERLPPPPPDPYAGLAAARLELGRLVATLEPLGARKDPSRTLRSLDRLADRKGGRAHFVNT
jgi:hypothetical protein